MRAVLLLQHSRFTTLKRAKEIVAERFALSNAQAYRVAGLAVDALGLVVTRYPQRYTEPVTKEKGRA